MNELALFAGAGGGILASYLLGWSTVAAVEIEKYPRDVLLQRQRDGILDPFPIWDDVRTFDGKPWRGTVDVVTGGFPCQDISVAGGREGLTGARSSLWHQYLRIVEEVQPRYVFAENSPNLRKHGLGTVLEGLARLGYDTRWGVLGARHLGMPHRRDRMWILGHSNQQRLEGHAGHGCDKCEQGRIHKEPLRSTCETGVQPGAWRRVVYASECNDFGDCPVCSIDYADCGCPGPTQDGIDYAEHNGELYGRPEGYWSTEPSVGRVAHGVADRVDRLKAIGNGQVPAVAAAAWQILSKGIA